MVGGIHVGECEKRAYMCVDTLLNEEIIYVNLYTQLESSKNTHVRSNGQHVCARVFVHTSGQQVVSLLFEVGLCYSQRAK